MTTHLLTTKLHSPPWRADGVSRPRLQQRLAAGVRPGNKLMLLCAPAGYGKTTLLSEWMQTPATRANGLRFAWLSLEPADDEPDRFLRYWLAAFAEVDGVLAGRLQPLLSPPQLLPTPLLLDALLNELAGSQIPLLMVLDDYHLIANSHIHEALEYFVDHQPAHVFLALTTRADPPLPLARLRARGQLVELRAHDLRFTPDEARDFLEASVHIPLAGDSLRALDERTEGWATGLQLAGLALQAVGAERRDDFIAGFRGSHRYVLDYLAEEVIGRQPEEVRSFLVRTSILERFTASACQALTGREDAAAVIAHLERANLFITPLDDERRWYRYHQLLRDYLRTLLDAGEEAELHRRAAAWHQDNGLAVEAVAHALVAGDPDFAAGVIARALADSAIWSAGDVALLASWLDALPPQALSGRPRLCLDAAHVFYLAGRFDLAEKTIALAEETLAVMPTAPDVEHQRALALLYRGEIASVRGETQQAIECIGRAQSRLPRQDHLAQARAFSGLGLAYELSGQAERAVQHYRESSDQAALAGVLALAIHARCAAAQVQVKQGRLCLAHDTCQEALDLAAGARPAPLGLVWIILGGIALERNDLAAGERFLSDGIALAGQGGLMDDVILGWSFLARLHAYGGDSTRALAVAQRTLSTMRAYGVPRMSLLAAAHLARVQLFLGDLPAAQAWAKEYEDIRAASPGEYEDLTWARVLLAAGRLDGLPAILPPLLEKAQRAGHGQACLEAHILLARYFHAQGDTPAGLEWLEKALCMAAPEGFARLFLDEGRPVLDLLPAARRAAPEFVDALLRAAQPVDACPNPLLAALPEPLSEQELRILRLIVAGRSNQEIAGELVITVGTAKWHVHNILQKLGVANRPQAIARARELGV